MYDAVQRSSIKVIILAAGEGRRLRPYTLDRPKCLVEVGGRSLLDRQLDVLRSRGLDRIVVVGGYCAEKLQRPDFDLRLNTRYAETNMVWTLFAAEDEMEGELIVAYGDIVYSGVNLDLLLASKADIAVAVDKDWESYWRARSDDPLSDAESLKLDEDGRILELGQRPRCIEEIQAQYMGLMKFSAKGLACLKDVFREAKSNKNLRGKLPERAYMTDLIQLVIDHGFRVDAVPVYGGWIEIDTVADRDSEHTGSRLKNIIRNT
jgi:choline kinase